MKPLIEAPDSKRVDCVFRALARLLSPPPENRILIARFVPIPDNTSNVLNFKVLLMIRKAYLLIDLTEPCKLCRIPCRSFTVPTHGCFGTDAPWRLRLTPGACTDSGIASGMEANLSQILQVG